MKRRITKVMAGAAALAAFALGGATIAQTVGNSSGSTTTNDNGIAPAHSGGALPQRADETG